MIKSKKNLTIYNRNCRNSDNWSKVLGSTSVSVLELGLSLDLTLPYLHYLRQITHLCQAFTFSLMTALQSLLYWGKY